MSAALRLRTGRPARTIAREQAVAAGGQLMAGTGNLLFALVTARLLDPASYAELAAFLALYLLIYLPAGSLSAGSALAPEMARAARRRVLGIGLAVSAGVVAIGVPLGAQARLPLALVLALAAAAPAAGLLALERGRLYGSGRYGQAVASLVIEPALRLTVGLALATVLGAGGAAIGVTLAGYAALATASHRRRDPPPRGRTAVPEGREPGLGQSWLAVLVFLLLAVVQNQDVLVANAALAPHEAGRFAVVSTLGGIAAFATTTVPLVLLPRAAAGQRHALSTAIGAALVLGGGAVAAVLVAPHLIVAGIFGQRYASVAGLAAPYLAAMALLGVARVLAAHAAATGRARTTAWLLGAVVPLHLGLIVSLGHDARGVAGATLAATAVLTAALGGAAVLRLPGVRGRTQRARTLLLRPSTLAVLGLTGLALCLRLLTTRGLWVDEATTWYQAQLPFGQMLDNLRTTDVHPPLHHALVWLSVRLLGDGELALRTPSIIAGTLLVPVLYLAGKAVYDRRTGLIAAALGSVGPILVWYSQEARMYALLALLAGVAIWAQARALRGGSPLHWLGYALAAAGMVWTHYFGLLLVLVLELGFLGAIWAGRRERGLLRQLLPFLGVTIVVVALLVPLVPFAHDQFSVNEAAGRGFNQPSQVGGDVAAGRDQISVYAAITNGVWAVGGYHANGTMTKLVALWPLGMLLALMLLGRGRSRGTWLLLAAAVVPGILLTAVATRKPFLFELRYDMASVPAMVLLGARALATWPRERATAALATVAAVAVLLAGVADQELNGTNPRLYDFKGSLTELSGHMRRGDVLLYEPQYLDNVIRYYAPELRTRRLDPRRLPKASPRHRVFVLASFLDKPQHRSQTRQAISELDRQAHPFNRFHRPQVRVWGFE